MLRDPVSDYAQSVIDGRQVTGELVRLACQRHFNDLATGSARGLRFDADAARRAIEFFGFLKHYKGEWAGRQFRLGPWQEFIVGSIFGWQQRYGRCPTCDSWLPVSGGIDCIPCDYQGEPAEEGWYRRFRTAYNEVARKNGKSTLSAGIGLLLAFFDNEPGAEVYTSATKRDQAKIIWGAAKQMVRKSPELSASIQVLVANLHDKDTNSKFEPLAAEDKETDGLDVHGNLVDELHAHKTRGLWDVLITAMGARRQPLTFAVTTAGYDRESICWEQRELAVQVLKGVLDDDSIFAYVATIDEGDDWRDSSCWIKANPNLGVSVKLEYLQRQSKQAQASPAKQNTFLRLHLSVWTQQSDRWIDLNLWQTNGKIVDATALKGRECYGALDVATVNDLTSWTMVFPREDKIDVLSRFWCPKARLTDSANRYRDQYQVWADRGFLTVTPGNATDFNFIKAQVLQDATDYDLKELGIDPWQGHHIAMDLQEEGLTVVEMRQGFMTFAAPMNELMRLLLLKGVNHGGNPVLNWMADNVAVKQDPAGNLKPDKSTSQGKIDGIVTLVMAIGRMIVATDDQQAGVMFA